MNAILLAIDDGWTAANYNWADTFFIVGAVIALIAAFIYFAGVPTTRTANPDPPPHSGYHVRWHGWAPGLLALAVASVAFALFLL
jgi:hypothetical protein